MAEGAMDLFRIPGSPFTVDRTYAPRFQGLIDDLTAAGYAIDRSQSGGYNPRTIAGTSTPSQHAFGRAIDINWSDNARGTRGNIDPDLARSLAKKHGLTWGGDWGNSDPMHFEIANADRSTSGTHAHNDSHTTASPSSLSGAFTMTGRYTPQPLIDRQYESADRLSNQRWSPTWAGVLAAGLGGLGGGLHRNAAQSATQSNQSLMSQALRNAGNAKSPEDVASALIASGVPDLEKSGVEQKMRLLADDPHKPYRVRAAQWKEMGYDERTPGYREWVLSGKLADGDTALDQARLKLIEAQTEAVRSKATATQDVDALRVEELKKMGLDPESAEGRVYRLNGKLPAQGYQNLQQIQLRERSAPKIAAGLENLKGMTETYDDPSFENAVGPFQGSTPGGLMGSIPINIGRLFGEVANWFEGGGNNPSEVRANIQGATEALAAAIKPLIRGPGEGVWTDADQERLVAVVGDLAQSRSKDEFKRRLNDVRDRIKSSFNLDVGFDAIANASEPPEAAINLLRRDVSPEAIQEFDEVFGEGAAAKALGAR